MKQLPPPTLSYSLDYTPKQFHSLVSINNFMTPDQCKKFIDYYDHPDRWEQSKIGGQNSRVHTSYRSSHQQFIFDDHDIGAPLANAITRINAGKFNYDLTHIEVVQFVRYEEGDFFDWHVDCFEESYNYRKLSITVQLTDPTEYQGGDLQISMGSGDVCTAIRDQGSLSMFPSFTQHCVTPVTKGTRYSLVAWVVGPPFK